MSAIFSNNTQGSSETTQAAVKADLDTIVTNTTGAATAAAQATGNASLATIVTNTTGLSNPTSSFIHSDTATTTGVQPTQDAGVGNLVKYFSIVVKGTGAVPTLSTVNLEGSLDGTNWTVLLTVTQTLDGQITATPNAFPVRYFRSNITTLTLGSATNVVIIVAAMK